MSLRLATTGRVSVATLPKASLRVAVPARSAAKPVPRLLDARSLRAAGMHASDLKCDPLQAFSLWQESTLQQICAAQESQSG